MTDAAEVYRAQAAPAAIEASLATKTPKAVVGTLNEDGTIHLAFVIFLYENGRFYFETSSLTKKARNAAARPTASFAIEGPGFMAMAEGTAQVIAGDEAKAINARLRAKYLTPEARGSVGEAWGELDDVAVEITPVKWRSWSAEKFRDLTVEAADGADVWLPDD